MDINSIVALSSALAALAALVVALITYFQLKHSRFGLGVDLMLKLEDSFFSAPDMKAARSRAANALRSDGAPEEIEPVLDFFETVGVLVRRHAVDEEFAWSSFCHWALRYSALARRQIQARRELESDPTYYSEFDFLVDRLTRIEMKKRQLRTPPEYSPDALNQFLDDEASEGAGMDEST